MDSSHLTSANNKFALDLFKIVFTEKHKENVFVSPFSISAALAMTHLGAKEATAQGIAKALCWQPDTECEIKEQFQAYLSLLKTPSDKFKLSTANRIFLQEGFMILDDFKTKANKYFLAGKLYNIYIT